MNAVRYSSKAPAKIAPKKKPAFNAQGFLDSSGAARQIVEYRRLENIYVQGDLATTILYIQRGGVKLTVVNEVGKEAVVAILGPGDFFGEGAWRVRLFAWGRRPLLHPRLYLLLKKRK